MYTDKEMIIWSLISSMTKSSNKIDFFRYSPIKLNFIFQKSLEENINLFKTSTDEKTIFFDTINNQLSLETIELFFNNSLLKQLEKQVNIEIDIMEKYNISFITYLSPKYPIRLKNSSLPPFVIYYKGSFPTDNLLKNSLAIVGTRLPLMDNIKQFTELLAFNLKKRINYNISGLAKGCDTIGHIEALKHGIKNIAILGQGLATPIYPQENNYLADKILKKQGVLISEIPPTIPVKQIYLLQRNRLQVYLSDGIFILETGLKGVTIQTLKIALKEKKYIYLRDISSNYPLIKRKNELIKFVSYDFLPFEKEKTLF